MLATPLRERNHTSAPTCATDNGAMQPYSRVRLVSVHSVGPPEKLFRISTLFCLKMSTASFVPMGQSAVMLSASPRLAVTAENGVKCRGSSASLMASVSRPFTMSSRFW